MRLGDLLPFLFVILVLIALVGAIGGAVYLVLRLRAGERISFPMRALFRVYLYVITLISLVTLVAGLSDLLQAGLGAALGKEFSYNPIFTSESFRPEPVKVPNGTVETPPVDPKADEVRRQEGLTRAMKEGILNGLSLAIVGGLILGLHAWGRRRLETSEERQGIFHRVYLILLLVIFGIITLVMLPSALYDALRFYLLEPPHFLGYGDRPGESLATAIVALPVWVFYLRGAVSMLRKSNGNNAESAPAL